MWLICLVVVSVLVLCHLQECQRKKKEDRNRFLNAKGHSGHLLFFIKEAHNFTIMSALGEDLQHTEIIDHSADRHQATKKHVDRNHGTVLLLQNSHSLVLSDIPQGWLCFLRGRIKSTARLEAKNNEVQCSLLQKHHFKIY